MLLTAMPSRHTRSHDNENPMVAVPLEVATPRGRNGRKQTCKCFTNTCTHTQLPLAHRTLAPPCSTAPHTHASMPCLHAPTGSSSTHIAACTRGRHMVWQGLCGPAAVPRHWCYVQQQLVLHNEACRNTRQGTLLKSPDHTRSH